MLPESDRPILFFDGVCNLCNRYVQIIIKKDRKGIFRFSSLQSETGAELLKQIQNEKGIVPDSVVLLYKGRYYTRSEAIIRIALLLGGIYSVLKVGYVLPRFIRDSMYDFVAKRRYKWFGREDECMIPSPNLQSRFID